MKPIHECVELVSSYGDEFDEQLRFHLNKGWVYSGEDCFVMATIEPLMELDLNSEELLRHNLNKTLDKKIWYIYVYVGSLKRVLELIPFDLGYVAFRRDGGKVKLYDMKKLIRRIK